MLGVTVGVVEGRVVVRVGGIAKTVSPFAKTSNEKKNKQHKTNIIFFILIVHRNKHNLECQ